MPPFFKPRGKFLIALILGGTAGVIALVALAWLAINPRFTSMIEGAEFRAELDKQTSKGLHFTGQYEPIRRTGFASAATRGFHAIDGVKAMRSLEAHEVTAQFNPWGLFLRRWQLDEVRIKRGIVEVQTYEPKPNPPKRRPWYAIFLPDRVYLREVTCPDADITWRLKGERAGIFHTQLLITPYGRDFEYRAKGGTLRSGGLAPDMTVRAIHMVITKAILEVHRLELATQEGGSVRVFGKAGMRDDKSVDARVELADVAISPWLPEPLAKGMSGQAQGWVTWKGADQTLEASSGEGGLRVADGELNDLELLDYLAAATGKKRLERLALDRCEVKFRWKFPAFEITALDLGSDGKFALRGNGSIREGGALDGTFELGLAPALLDWLPRAREDVFTRAAKGMVWTTVRLSGTLKDPENDLTPRLARAMRKDPAAAAGLLFRGIGEWLEQKSRGR